MATTRMGIPLPLETDSPDGPAQLTTAANRIDAVGAMFDQGTLAGRPAFGTRGRFYWATDQGRGGQLWYDTGTAWVAVEPNRPGIRYGPTTNTPIAAGGTVAVPMPAAYTGDAIGAWGGSITAGVRIVPGASGYYSFLATAGMATGAAPIWSFWVFRKPAAAPVGSGVANGSQAIALVGGTTGLFFHASGTVYLYATDGIEMLATSNGAMALTTAGDTYPTGIWIAQVA